MKDKTRNTIICYIIAVVILVAFLLSYMVIHPEIRNISYYDDENYYMVNAITGNGETLDSWHFGAIKKKDYEAWADGTASTVWVVSSTNENKGWLLRCNMILTINIYDRDRLPFNF